MGRRIVSRGCHLAERKNGDFAALWRLSPDGEELDGAEKTATLQLSDGCHPTERSWMEVGHVSGASFSSPRSKKRLFIASISFSCMYDHSLPHNQLATVGE
ncbi:unnamed protein product [Spirodela intermedia]|uniref:Uncharacterized protein n=1 Tax=Spirodela intermedia TaxID=51605 RepID=A0A7I8J292_SPIIN|nr:unnamed protein product [Spirodela intermedia]CAA6664278.1 unnamed protein product [Spirodela intermedia]